MALDGSRIHLVQADDLHFVDTRRGAAPDFDALPPGGIVFHRQGQPRKVSDRIQTYALYIDPPLGRVGLSEASPILKLGP